VLGTQLGSSVAVDSATAVVGPFSDNDGDVPSGAAYAFPLALPAPSPGSD